MGFLKMVLHLEHAVTLTACVYEKVVDSFQAYERPGTD